MMRSRRNRGLSIVLDGRYPWLAKWHRRVYTELVNQLG